jgi:hypothetical protein
MIDWNIQPRASACQTCHHPFADQDVYHTLLSDGAAGYLRLDVCARCWSGAAGDAAARPGYISHWQGTFEVPPPQPELIRRETAETLLHKLLELNDPSHLAAQYILAVMLERKRLLKVKDQIRRDGQRVFVYEHPRTGDVFTIVDPELNLDQLEAVQRDVARLLEHGLEAPSAAPADPSPEVGGDPGAAAAAPDDQSSSAPGTGETP